METGDLQRLFNKVIIGETVTIAFFDQRAYESCRVAIVRKFKSYKSQLESIGFDSSVSGKFLKCSFKREGVLGTFRLCDIESKIKPYTITAGEL